MKKIAKHKSFLLCIFSLLAISFSVLAQADEYRKARAELKERGEVYFSFQAEQPGVISNFQRLKSAISIDKFEHGQVWAYANQRGFDQLVNWGIEIELLTPPSMLHQPAMSDFKGGRLNNDWDYYPTYEGYYDIMYQFAEDYPDLCEVVSIKTLSSGRELLFVHINDSLGVNQSEPEFMYTGTMHGDETAGYVMLLHLTDYLLSNYGTDSRITEMVNNIDIWINPLANPDGTYAGGNNTVYGAKRFNANNVDLNRNYPDPEDGTNPDGNSHQPETVAFMDFAEDHDFVMSANTHGGTEVCNYPWDTWSRRHADDDWWYYVCRMYADTAHEYSPAGYLTDLNNGVTNGYDWYSISGGRQDYMTYFHQGREFTLELSAQKLLPESQILNWWNYNYRSLLNYMEQVMYGVRGTVTSSQSGDPVKALIFFEDHDKDNSEVYSFADLGDYYRPIKAGIYDITFSADGFESKTIMGVEVADMDTTILNVSLDSSVGLAELQFAELEFYPNPVISNLTVRNGHRLDSYALYDLNGRLIVTEEVNALKLDVDVSTFETGVYILMLESGGIRHTRRIVKR